MSEPVLDRALLPAGCTVLCAVSGGADSVCLLDLVRRLGDVTALCAHFDHGIRGAESARDAAFVEALCEEWGVPFFLGRGDVPAYAAENGLSIETAARELRYAFLERTAKEQGADVIATAHNLNDNAETILFRMARGTGLRGLAGIPARRGKIVRPLLQTPRRDIEEYLAAHGRPEAYRRLQPGEGARYDGMITIDLGKVEPMAALPFHPSRAFTIRQLQENGADILRQTELLALEQFGGKVELKLTDKLKDGKLRVDQGVIAGCSGGMYDNIAEAAAILDGHDVGNGYFSLSVYPPSVPVNLQLIRDGVQEKLLEAGALFKPCFCGPCFGAGDVPANNGLSVRHTTRNFPNREGSKPANGQLAGVVLMDARSIAATARNHGVLTAATEIDYTQPAPHAYQFDKSVYEKRCYFGFGKADESAELILGPNITEWPKIPALRDNLLMKLACVIHDPVTTTDELIPSGETSSYRSNPMKLATFALSRREPQYVARTGKIRALEDARAAGKPEQETLDALARAGISAGVLKDTQIGSVIFANKPGDGSAREQAASCQRVLGGCANICYEFATKRYRSNCINWGMMPFTIDEDRAFDYSCDDYVFVPGIRAAIEMGAKDVPATVITKSGTEDILLHLPELTDDERQILLDGCLMNFYAANSKKETK